MRGFDGGLPDAQNEQMRSLGINALRRLPGHGNIAWGARTPGGVGALASEWKYTQARRLALFVEKSLYRELQLVAFETR